MDHGNVVTAPIQVVDLARSGVAAIAPEELRLFDEMAQAWLDGRLAYRRPPGGTARIGVPTDLDIKLIFDVITGTLAAVLGEVAYAKMKDRRWSFRRRKPQAQVAIEPAHQAELRATLEKNAQALGLSKAKSRLLADSVFGPQTGRAS